MLLKPASTLLQPAPPPLWVLAAVAAWLAPAALPADPVVTPLSNGWALQSSARVHEGGAVVSAPGYDAAAWHKTGVPATVMAALVANGVYSDPYFGSNLRSIPGAAPSGENFSNLPMPGDSPFRVAWWYRKEFDAPAAAPGSVFWLRFDGINYRANIWLNGELLAGE
jgi:exo-1,4-beta-D-glucosaminidase